MLTFIVLPHWSIMSDATFDMIPHPVTLSWHWVNQSLLYPVSLSDKQDVANAIFNDFGMLRSGMQPVTFCSPEWTFYRMSYWGRYILNWKTFKSNMNIETLMVASNNVDFLGGFGGWMLDVDTGGGCWDGCWRTHKCTNRWKVGKIRYPIPVASNQGPPGVKH